MARLRDPWGVVGNLNCDSCMCACVNVCACLVGAVCIVGGLGSLHGGDLGRMIECVCVCVCARVRVRECTCV